MNSQPDLNSTTTPVPTSFGALATLVKTPGLTPVKNRLSKAIGTIPAQTFYQLSTRALEVTLKQLHETQIESTLLRCFWAVSESQAMEHPLWKGLPRIHQGEGNLGDQTFQTYHRLLEQHRFAILINSDVPQISVEVIQSAAQALASGSDFVLGPCDDGGYYLWGGSKPLPEPVFQAIPYGEKNSFKVLTKILSNVGNLHTLPPLFDIDTHEDLERLELEFATLKHQQGGQALSPEQQVLLDWVNKLGLNN